MLENYPDVLTSDCVCQILGICTNTLYTLIKQEKIKAVKVGHTYRIPKKHLIEFLEAGDSKERK